jgi:hypothetical protein
MFLTANTRTSVQEGIYGPQYTKGNKYGADSRFHAEKGYVTELK